MVDIHFVRDVGGFEAPKCCRGEKMALKVYVEVAYRVRIGVRRVRIGVEALPLYATGAWSQEKLAYRGRALRIGCV